MPNLSLMSFMNILSKNTTQKMSAYGRYLTPGGFDYYSSLKENAHALTVGHESYDNCAGSIAEINDESRRKYCLEGLKALHKWRQKAAENIGGFFLAPASSCSSPNGFLTVKLEPEFGVIYKGNRLLVQIWTSNTSNLSTQAAGVGAYLLSSHLCQGEFANCKGAVLDLRKKGLFLYDALPPAIPIIVATEFAWADAFFKSQKKAA